MHNLICKLFGDVEWDLNEDEVKAFVRVNKENGTKVTLQHMTIGGAEYGLFEGPKE